MMTEYFTLIRSMIELTTIRDWALAAAVFFVVVFGLRVLRMMRQRSAQALRTTSGPKGTAVPANESSDLARKPIPRPRRPVSRNRALGEGEAVNAQPASMTSQAPAIQTQITSVEPLPEAAPSNVANALAKVSFAAKPMMPWGKYCLLRDIEAFLSDHGAGHRLFSHVQLSDVFGVDSAHMSDELTDAVSRALAPFRFDFLILDRQGMPALALQMGSTNPVLETVCIKANVALLMLPADYSWLTVETQLAQHLGDPAQPMRQAG